MAATKPAASAGHRGRDGYRVVARQPGRSEAFGSDPARGAAHLIGERLLLQQQELESNSSYKQVLAAVEGVAARRAGART